MRHAVTRSGRALFDRHEGAAWPRSAWVEPSTAELAEAIASALASLRLGYCRWESKSWDSAQPAGMAVSISNSVIGPVRLTDPCSTSSNMG